MNHMQKKELIGLSAKQMEELFIKCGQPPYRGRQLFHALYRERQCDLNRITTLSARLRRQLDQQFQATLPQIQETFQSSDGTCRYLLCLADGTGIETVWMPEEERSTICLSTQAGCAVGCKFCLTGVMGFRRNLTAGEIVGQVLLLMQENRWEAAARRRTQQRRLNLVFMGMGEPLLNYDRVLEAVRLLAEPDGIALSLAHMTLSTSGIVPGIQRLAMEAVRPKLAVSMNATTDEMRDRIMPINQKWPLAELLQACREFPLRSGERLTFEYVLLNEVNDTLEDARRLSKLISGLRSKVNLIGLNPGAELPFATPPDERIYRFQQTLIQNGIPAYIRKPRGRDIFAACGQLKLARADALYRFHN